MPNQNLEFKIQDEVPLFKPLRRNRALNSKWYRTFIIPTTDQPFIQENTKGIKLVITSVLGTAEMGWEMK